MKYFRVNFNLKSFIFSQQNVNYSDQIEIAFFHQQLAKTETKQYDDRSQKQIQY